MDQMQSLNGMRYRWIILFRQNEEVRPETGLNMLFFMLTDILEESTMLLCVGPDALPKVAEDSGCPVQGNVVMMEGVVSSEAGCIRTLMQAFQS